ncbi:hypothetical protein [Streptomyces sp. NBC_01276]|uniref:hypothetical protein n=1 Tax=Streptomyces sp. NBC_01276 TaxID=2903808 RepID=UPI00352EAD95
MTEVLRRPAGIPAVFPIVRLPRRNGDDHQGDGLIGHPGAYAGAITVPPRLLGFGITRAVRPVRGTRARRNRA